MQITITGQHLKTGESLQDHINNRLQHGVKKYFDRAVSADVVLNKHGAAYSCDIRVNEGTHRHMVIKARADAVDVYAAFDTAMIRIEKQLRRYKSRLTDHHHTPLKTMETDALTGMHYLIAPPMEEEVLADNPVIVAEKPAELHSLSVGDAVMRMDLAHLPAYVFINSQTQRVNVVYHRADGHIAWIDTGATHKA